MEAAERRLHSFRLEMISECIWHRGRMPRLPEALAETLRSGPDLLGRRFADPWPDGFSDIGDYLNGERRGLAVRAMREDAKWARDA